MWEAENERVRSTEAWEAPIWPGRTKYYTSIMLHSTVHRRMLESRQAVAFSFSSSPSSSSSPPRPRPPSHAANNWNWFTDA
jgi:hypothetical protein